MHGGKSPQAQASARERLAALAVLAVTRLGTLIDEKNPAVALGAVRTTLDFAGMREPSRVELEVIEADAPEAGLHALPTPRLLRLFALRAASAAGRALSNAEACELGELMAEQARGVAGKEDG